MKDDPPNGGDPSDDTRPLLLAAEESQTDWSMIYRARAGTKESGEAWEQIARRYWPAIYAYLRGTGRDVDEAADLTQGFVCDVLIARGMVAVADPDRGRFRTLLLSALKNYVAEQHRYANRRRRAPSGGARIVELEERSNEIISRITPADPETAFATQWSVSLVHRVLDRVREACEKEELAAHWTVFELRVVRPLLLGEPPVAYGILVNRFDLRDAGQAANMMITVKRRFARALLDEVEQTVSDPTQAGDELYDLLHALERSR